MKTILSFFLVLLFVAGCGGGDGGQNNAMPSTDPDSSNTPDNGSGEVEVCTEENVPLPRGVHPIESDTTFTAPDGTEYTLNTDGTFCGLGLCHPQWMWVWAQDRCLCISIYNPLDDTSFVLCSTDVGSCETCYTSSGFSEDDEVLEQLLDSASEILTELE